MIRGIMVTVSNRSDVLSVSGQALFRTAVIVLLSCQASLICVRAQGIVSANGGRVVRIGVLTDVRSGDETRRDETVRSGDETRRDETVRCGNLTGDDLTVLVHVFQADFNTLHDLNQTMRSLLQHIAVDFLLINASGSQDSPINTLLRRSPLPDALGNTSVMASDAVPSRDVQWCCAFCCPGNANGGTGAELSRGLTRLKKDDTMVRFTQTVLTSLGWSTAFIVFDDGNEEFVQTLTTHLSDTHSGILYRLVNTVSRGNGSALQRSIADTLLSSDTINGVIACSLRCILNVLNRTLSLESEFKRRVSVIMSTNWVLVPTSTPTMDVAILKEIFALGFDNIAVLADPASLPYPYTVPWEFTCSDLTVSTLLWKGGERRQLSPVGHYCSHKGPEIMSDIFPNTRFGFNGRPFIVSTMLWDPYIMKEERNGTNYFYGMCADLLEELAITLNFTYTWTQPPDMMWGHNNSGNWSGLVGQLNRQEVDLTVAPLAMGKEREEAMDFTFPFFHDFSGVLLKRPDPNARKWRTYIDIFRWEVLVCLALALAGSAAVAITIEFGERSIFGKPDIWAAFNKFWVVLGALLCQGSYRLPGRGSGRVFLSAWWIFAIIVAATYSANLIASLTVTKDKPPFDSLADMVKQSDYTYGTIDQSMWTMLFEFSNSPTYQAIHRNIHKFADEDPRVLDQDPYVHLEKVREGGYAYIADTGLFDNWLATNCDLMLIKEKFYPSRYAVGLPNDSAYTKLFSDQIMKIYEGGLLGVWIKRWWPKRNFCGGALTTEAKVLELADIQSVFYVAGLGFGLSALALLLEYVLLAVCGNLRTRVCGPKGNTKLPTKSGHTGEEGEEKGKEERHQNGKIGMPRTR